MEPTQACLDGKTKYVKMSVLPKLIYKFNTVQSKFQSFLGEEWQNYFEMPWIKK